MTIRSLPRVALSLLIALLLGITPALGLLPIAPPRAAEAFNPPIHIAMFRETVGDKFSPGARAAVARGLELSDGVDGQGRPEWHFDSANNREAICALWSMTAPTGQGPDALLKAAEQRAVEGFRALTKTPFLDLFDRELWFIRTDVLQIYGQYLHAVQDFYTHTNWIELHLDPTKTNTLATIPTLAPIQAGCKAEELKDGLRSGFFGFDSKHPVDTLLSSGPDFCGPVTGPRPPKESEATICHGPPHPDTWRGILRRIGIAIANRRAGRDVRVSTLDPRLMLAKDLPDLFHGGELLTRPDGTLTTYHEEAVRLATEATRESFDVFKQRVVAQLTTDLPNRDPECLFQVLLKGGNPACPKLQGRRYETDTPLKGTLGILSYTLDSQRYTTTSLHVEIILDPATNQATGSLSVEIFSQEYKDQSVTNPVWSPEYLFTFTGTTETPGTFDGTDGGIAFTGTEVQMVGWAGDQVRRESPRSLGFRLALDDQGRLALCSTGSFSTEPAARRQECLDYAYAVLEPVDGGVSPPTPPIT